MHIREFTTEDYPALAAIHNSIGVIYPERPTTGEGWAAAEANRSSKCQYGRWVAEMDGKVVGFSQYGQSIWAYKPDRFNINVEVHPDYQRQGIGSALYAQMIDALAAFNPRVLRADAFTNLPQGFPFLQKRGFYEAFRETPVHIDPATFDTTQYESRYARLNAEGYDIRSLAELTDDPDRDRKIYRLYWKIDADVPNEDEFSSEPEPFEIWAKLAIYYPQILPDGYFIATYGDDYVGLCEQGAERDTHSLWGGLLGVHADHRGHGLGTALQARAIVYAKEHAYPVLRTCTAIQNAPMQAMFNRLGFERDPEWLQCQKDIT